MAEGVERRGTRHSPAARSLSFSLSLPLPPSLPSTPALSPSLSFSPLPSPPRCPPPPLAAPLPPPSPFSMASSSDMSSPLSGGAGSSSRGVAAGSLGPGSVLLLSSLFELASSASLCLSQSCGGSRPFALSVGALSCLAVTAVLALALRLPLPIRTPPTLPASLTLLLLLWWMLGTLVLTFIGPFTQVRSRPRPSSPSLPHCIPYLLALPFSRPFSPSIHLRFCSLPEEREVARVRSISVNGERGGAGILFLSTEKGRGEKVDGLSLLALSRLHSLLPVGVGQGGRGVEQTSSQRSQKAASVRLLGLLRTLCRDLFSLSEQAGRTCPSASVMDRRCT